MGGCARPVPDNMSDWVFVGFLLSHVGRFRLLTEHIVKSPHPSITPLLTWNSRLSLYAVVWWTRLKELKTDTFHFGQSQIKTFIFQLKRMRVDGLPRAYACNLRKRNEKMYLAHKSGYPWLSGCFPWAAFELLHHVQHNILLKLFFSLYQTQSPRNTHTHFCICSVQSIIFFFIYLPPLR